MIKKIYHGSERKIENPMYGFGKSYNDYGLGFYCTESLELAKEWAVTMDKDGYANAYEIETDDLKILNLNDDKYCILHWLAILLKNRQFDIPSVLANEAKEYLLKYFLIDYEKYDVIVGYRADDSYFSFAQDFINGTISYRQLKNAMYLGDLGNQFVLKSKKAFSKIKFLDSIKYSNFEWFVRKELRDRKARCDYFDIRKNKREKGDLYITNILDERMMPDDERL